MQVGEASPPVDQHASTAAWQAARTDREPVPSLRQQLAGEGRTGNDFIAADGTYLLGEYLRMEEIHRSQISYSLHNIDVSPVSIFSLSSLPTVREELRGVHCCTGPSSNFCYVYLLPKKKKISKISNNNNKRQKIPPLKLTYQI